MSAKQSDFKKELLGLQGNLLSFAYSLTANRDDAYDLVQDTTLKALDNENKYVEDTNFKGWLMTIMRNIFINNYRKNSRTEVVSEQGDEGFMLSIPVEGSAHETPEGAVAVSDIDKSLNSLQDVYREPFSLFLAGYKYEEIAEKLSVPLGTIKSRIFFARKRLQEMLKDYR